MKYILFGCGEFTKRLMPKIEAVLEIKYVCDNNLDLVDKVWMDKFYCISPDALNEYTDFQVLISVENEDYYLQIKQQLKEKDIDAEHINAALSKAWINNGGELETELFALKNAVEQKIILLGAPAHSNLGDQAQSYCFELLMKEQYPNKKLYIFEGHLLREHFYYRLYLLQYLVSERDIIVLHSGYHCTDLFLKEERLNEKIIELFENKKLLMLPQTINFKSDELRKKSSAIFSNHKNLTIMCRDKVSYESAKVYYSKNKLLLYPDLVTSLIGRRVYECKREGILLCLRKLGTEESDFTENKKNELIKKLEKLATVTVTDTDSKLDWREIRKDRKRVIEDEIAYYAKFQVIVTDRYHGMIFSLIANTPVVVISSTDHKISSGTDWFPEDIYSGFRYTKKEEDVLQAVEAALKEQGKTVNPACLYTKYYKQFNLIKQMEE